MTFKQFFFHKIVFEFFRFMRKFLFFIISNYLGHFYIFIRDCEQNPSLTNSILSTEIYVYIIVFHENV